MRLSETERMRLAGRIDRVDLREEDDRIYVKIIDYKSGNKDMDVAAIYHGLQLQLVVYADMASKYVQRMHPEKKVIPAAMLYYRLYDPMIRDEDVGTDPERINEKIRDKLMMSGLVSDSASTDLADTVPEKVFMDGDTLSVISDYVNHKIRSFGRRILSGEIARKPYQYGTKDGCTYCPFTDVCGFHEKIPGCEKRRLSKPDDVIEAMREELA